MSHNPNLDKILSRLDGVRTRADGQWSAKCPAHEDRSPSLSIREMGDGRILLHCFALCGAQAVVEAVGMSLSDLMGDSDEHKPPVRARDRWILRDVLSSLSHDALIVMLCAQDMRDGHSLPDADLERLAVSVDRIRDACQQAGVPIKRGQNG